MPLYPQSATGQGVHPTPSLFSIFTFGLAIKFIKKLGGASEGELKKSAWFAWKMRWKLCLQWHLIKQVGDGNYEVQ